MVLPGAAAGTPASRVAVSSSPAPRLPDTCLCLLGPPGARRLRDWLSTWPEPDRVASDHAPTPAANITMFRPSTFFILVQTGLGLQLEVQLVPLMQVFLRLDPAYRGQMCGEAGHELGGVGSGGGAGLRSLVQAGDSRQLQETGLGTQRLLGAPGD